MKPMLLAAAAGLSLVASTAANADGGAASPAETQVLAASGVQQGAWIVNGYGIAPAARTASTAPAAQQTSGQKCYYVLDVLLCD